MNFARVVPAVLAFLLLGAHFHRAGMTLLVPACIALAVIACIPRRWAVTLAQVALVLAALEWVRTLSAFAAARVAQGGPVLRLVLILGAVVAFTLWAAWLLRSRAGAARIGGRTDVA